MADGNNAPDPNEDEILDDAIAVEDERANDPDEMPNAEIDRQILFHHERFGTTLIDQLFFQIRFQTNNQIFYLNINLTIIVIIDPLPTFVNLIAAMLRRSQVEPPRVANHHFIDFDRDAQAEGRVDYPTDDGLTFSDTVTLAEDDQIGIENTEEHDERLFADVTTNRNTYFIINDDVNGHINEDATLYDHGDAYGFNLNQQNLENAQVNTNLNEMGEVAIDDLTHNINPVVSTETKETTQCCDADVSTIMTTHDILSTDDKQLEDSSTVIIIDNTEDNDHSIVTHSTTEEVKDNVITCANQHVIFNVVTNENIEGASNNTSQLTDTNSTNTTNVTDLIENNLEAEETEQRRGNQTDDTNQVEQIENLQSTAVEQKQTNEIQRNPTLNEQN